MNNFVFPGLFYTKNNAMAVCLNLTTVVKNIEHCLQFHYRNTEIQTQYTATEKHNPNGWNKTD